MHTIGDTLRADNGAVLHPVIELDWERACDFMSAMPEALHDHLGEPLVHWTVSKDDFPDDADEDRGRIWPGPAADIELVEIQGLLFWYRDPEALA